MVEVNGLEPCLGGSRAQEPGLIFKKTVAPWAKVVDVTKNNVLSIEDQAKLLVSASTQLPGNTFVLDVAGFFERNGFISAGQITTLKDLLFDRMQAQANERRNRRRGGIPSPDELRRSLLRPDN